MSDLKRLKDEILADPETRAIYEERLPAYDLASKMIALRAELHLSQRDLANLTGMKQPQIARIETGESSPTWDTLSRIFTAVGAKLEITVKNAGGRSVKM